MYFLFPLVTNKEAATGFTSQRALHWLDIAFPQACRYKASGCEPRPAQRCPICVRIQSGNELSNRRNLEEPVQTGFFCSFIHFVLTKVICNTNTIFTTENIKMLNCNPHEICVYFQQMSHFMFVQITLTISCERITATGISSQIPELECIV